MNPTQAKSILLAYRPGMEDPDDHPLAEALELARRDPGLSEWLKHHLAFQSMMGRSLRDLPVPPQLAGRIRAGRPLTLKSGGWSRHPGWIAAAAAIVVLLGLALFQSGPVRDTPEDFSIFRSRMVRAVIRQYTMDIVTNDMNAVRIFLRSRQAPADYKLPQLLDQLPVFGAGVCKWQGEPVSMVCLDPPGEGRLFLFIVDESAVPKAPPAVPQFAQVSKLMTASWTTGGKTYVLAGTGGKASLQRHL